MAAQASVIRWLGTGMARQVPYSLGRFLVKRDVISVVYHVASDRHLPHIRHIYPYKSPEVFEQDLLALGEAYDLLSYDAISQLRREAADAPTSAVITVDDGYSEAFSVIRPLLLSHGVPAIFFVPTDFVGNRTLFYRNKVSLCIDRLRGLHEPEKMAMLQAAGRIAGRALTSSEALERWIFRLDYSEQPLLDGVCQLLGVDADEFLSTAKPYMTEGNITQLVADGFTVGSHSRFHAPMNAYGSYDEIEEEIVESCKAIRDLTGQREVPFAFPFSEAGVDPDRLERTVAAHEFVGLTFGTGGLRRGPSCLVNRVAMDSPTGTGGPGPPRSNVRMLLREAYGKQVIASALRWPRLQVSRTRHPVS
jgi:peptidoglycan/xylan/chitin deacetylase (PgdA/CDA1 family)